MKHSRYLIIILLALSVAPSFAIEVGDTAPPFVLTNIDRSYVFSKNIYGTGYVLLDFYATTCVNCNKELPLIEDIYLDHKDNGLQVLLMATDPEGSSIVKPFFEANPTPIPILLDRYQKSVESFGVEVLPTVFLINPEGKVVYKGTGFHPEVDDEIRAFLETE
ncbi:MAG: redoxin domain-containing protein [Spirochaetales bacterium]|nr:redoxin domain-containing protein [Spirochaetales bacterium]